MIGISAIIVLLIIGVGIWLWQSSMRARELAIIASKNACKKHNVQFLDGTTSFDKFAFKRNHSGRLGLVRRYKFEYFDGEFRYIGHVTIFQHKVVDIAIDAMASQDKKKHDLFSAANDNDNVIQFPFSTPPHPPNDTRIH